MSKEVTDQIGALLGGPKASAAGTPPAQGGDDRTQHELDVMKGRVKSLDARNKELEKELAKLRASRQSEDILSEALTDEERAALAPEFLNAAAKTAAAVEKRMRQEQEEREQKSAQEREESAKRAMEDFDRQLNEKYPGFFSSVGDGGANNAAWKEFYGLYGESINAAYAARDLARVDKFITLFNNQLGLRVPSGSQDRATVPDPRNLGSGAAVQLGDSNKVYSAQEYAALEKKAMQARRRGDWQEYQKLNDELNNILAENRVKD